MTFPRCVILSEAAIGREVEESAFSFLGITDPSTPLRSAQDDKSLTRYVIARRGKAPTWRSPAVAFPREIATGLAALVMTKKTFPSVEGGKNL